MSEQRDIPGDEDTSALKRDFERGIYERTDMEDKALASISTGNVKTIEALPPVGAYLCDSTAKYADYWLKGAKAQQNRAEALMCAEQAVNVWKNLAYDLARQAHYYLNTQARYTESETAALQHDVERAVANHTADLNAVSATPLKLSELVPTNWLDPLLTGPSAVFDATGCIKPKHIEALLRRLKKRLQEAEDVNAAR